MLYFNVDLPTLVIGGIFGAFGEALIWPAAPVYIDIILKNAWRRRTVEDPTDSIFKKSRSYDHERNVWLGSFYGILQNCLVMPFAFCNKVRPTAHNPFTIAGRKTLNTGCP